MLLHTVSHKDLYITADSGGNRSRARTFGSSGLTASGTLTVIPKKSFIATLTWEHASDQHGLCGLCHVRLLELLQGCSLPGLHFAVCHEPDVQPLGAVPTAPTGIQASNNALRKEAYRGLRRVLKSRALDLLAMAGASLQNCTSRGFRASRISPFRASYTATAWLQQQTRAMSEAETSVKLSNDRYDPFVVMGADADSLSPQSPKPLALKAR